MSEQLEVHHGALCTAPVSLNFCCCGPHPGHNPQEALTLWSILLWQLHSSRSNAKRYRGVYVVTPVLSSQTTQQLSWRKAGVMLEGRVGRLQGERTERRTKIRAKGEMSALPYLMHLWESPPCPGQCSVFSTNLGVCFWGNRCVWWQHWSSLLLLLPPSPWELRWRTWRWIQNSSRRSVHVSQCLQYSKKTNTLRYLFFIMLLTY